MGKLVRCNLTPEELEAFYDGELPRWRAAAVRAHVAVCADCQGYLRHLRAISAAMAAAETHEPSPAFTEAVVASLSGQRRPVLADLAPLLEAPEGIGGPELTAAVMERVRREGPAARLKRSGAAGVWVKRAALATAAAIVVLVLAALVGSGGFDRAVRSAGSRLGAIIQAAASPLADIRAAAEGIAELRWRQVRDSGLDLDIREATLRPRHTGAGWDTAIPAGPAAAAGRGLDRPTDPGGPPPSSDNEPRRR